MEQSTADTGKECVIVGNGVSLPITHTCNLSPSPDLKLLDVLVVPHLTKNLFSSVNSQIIFLYQLPLLIIFSLFRIA